MTSRDRILLLIKSVAVAMVAAIVVAAGFLLAGKRHDQNLHCWTTTNHQFIRAPGCVQK